MRKRQYRYQVDVSRGDPEYWIIHTRSYRYKKNALRNGQESKDILESLGLNLDDVEVIVVDTKTRTTLFQWSGSDSSTQAWT